MLAAIRWGIAQSSDVLNHALVCYPYYQPLYLKQYDQGPDATTAELDETDQLATLPVID